MIRPLNDLIRPVAATSAAAVLLLAPAADAASSMGIDQDCAIVGLVSVLEDADAEGVLGRFDARELRWRVDDGACGGRTLSRSWPEAGCQFDFTVVNGVLSGDQVVAVVSTGCLELPAAQIVLDRRMVVVDRETGLEQATLGLDLATIPVFLDRRVPATLAAAEGTVAAVTATGAGAATLQIVDLSEPAAPAITFTGPIPGDDAPGRQIGLAADPGHVAVALASDAEAPGLVQVLDRSTGQWGPSPSPAGRPPRRSFGTSVAFAGGMLFVAEPDVDGMLPDDGIVHVFDPSTGKSMAEIAAPNGARSLGFAGAGIRADGDRLVIASRPPFDPEDPGIADATVVVYQTGTLSQVLEITDPDPIPFRDFGGGLAIAGDVAWVTSRLPLDPAVRVHRFAIGPEPADVDQDGAVALSDLLAVLASWGPCDDCPADIDGDGAVTFGDLLAVLDAWSV